MTNRTVFYFTGLIAALAFIHFPILSALAGDLPEVQKAPLTLKADQVIPKNVVSGPNYQIEQKVQNDGFINTYRLTTDFGPLKIESTALLMERTNELKALSHMEAVAQTDTFAQALKKGATAPLRTAKGLVTAPVDTVSGIASGIGNWFQDIGHAITSDDPDQEGVLSAAVGYAGAKRKFAYEYGINPYTRYEPVQEKLTKMARAAVAGGLTPKAAFALVKKPVGTVLQVTGTADTMRQLVRDKSPAELDDINSEKLTAMGVSDAAVKDFLKNPYYDPYEETLLVGELETMQNVKGRENFIKMAGVAPDDMIARYMRIRAQMMAAYHKKIAPAERIVAAQGVPLLQRKDGVIAVLVPLDYVAWTQKLWLKESKGSDALERLPGFTGKEVWITGKFDPAAAKALESKGWKVKADFASKFLDK